MSSRSSVISGMVALLGRRSFFRSAGVSPACACTKSLQQAQPVAQGRIIEVAFQPVAQLDVVEDVAHRFIRMSAVPDLRWDLMVPRPGLERLLVRGAVKDQES